MNYNLNIYIYKVHQKGENHLFNHKLQNKDPIGKIEDSYV